MAEGFDDFGLLSNGRYDAAGEKRESGDKSRALHKLARVKGRCGASDFFVPVLIGSHCSVNDRPRGPFSVVGGHLLPWLVPCFCI